MPSLSIFDDAPWHVFRNDSGEEVPAFGVVRITGVVRLEPGRVVLTAEKPNTYGCQYQGAVAGPTRTPAGQFGICTRRAFVPALYEATDGTPAIGEYWGPRNGDWRLRKATGGFAVVGVTNGGAGLVLVQPNPFICFVGKTDAMHAKGTAGTVSIFSGVAGSESDTLENMAGVHNRFADVESGAWVRCEWNGILDSWELTAAECS